MEPPTPASTVCTGWKASLLIASSATTGSSTGCWVLKPFGSLARQSDQGCGRTNGQTSVISLYIRNRTTVRRNCTIRDNNQFFMGLTSLEDRVACPHCGRRFGQTQAARNLEQITAEAEKITKLPETKALVCFCDSGPST